MLQDAKLRKLTTVMLALLVVGSLSLAAGAIAPNTAYASLGREGAVGPKCLCQPQCTFLQWLEGSWQCNSGDHCADYADKYYTWANRTAVYACVACDCTQYPQCISKWECEPYCPHSW